MSKTKDIAEELKSRFAKDVDNILAYGPSKLAGADGVSKKRLLATQARIKEKRAKAKKPPEKS